MKLRKTHAAVVAALAGAAGLSTQVASAQEGLEEIVVTATRRSQDLQEVPISIVAITGDALETRGVQNVEGLNGTIPNLNIMGQAGGLGTAGTSFRVRGIPGVGTYIDGIWQLTTNGLLTQEFVDLDRVEVLRGPQGTLFGRDSVGGAIRIFTKQPSDEFGTTFKGTVGTYDRHDSSLSLDLPLSDEVLTKWTFASLNRDGYITSKTTGVKSGDIDQTVVRGDVLWQPTENLDVRFNLMQTENSFNEPRVQDAVWLTAINFPTNITNVYNAAGLSYTAQSQMAGWPGGEVSKWENRSQITIPNDIDTDQASIDINLALNDTMSLQFLTGYVEQNSKIFTDYDNSQYGLVEDTSHSNLKMFSQEIQLSGTHGRFQWVTGLFYWNQEQFLRSVRYATEEFNADPNLINIANATPYCQALLVNPPPGPSSTCSGALAFYSGFTTLNLNGGLGGSLTREEREGYAVFGEATVGLTDKLDVTFGLRKHDQDNENEPWIPSFAAPRFTNQNFALDPLAGRPTGNITPASFDKTTGRLSAQYQFTDNLMGYVSYSQGFNSGGAQFITLPGTTTQQLFAWQPESLDNFEVGVRSDLLDGRIRFNATVFDTEWDDIQSALTLRLNGQDLPGVVTQNIGRAEAQGAEFEFTFLPTDKLTFNANLGLLDAKFNEIYIQTAAGFVPGETEFSQAPKKTANLGFQYDASVANGGTFSTRLDYTYSDQYWRQFDPTLRTAWYPGVPAGWNDETGDFGTVNARFTYSPPDNRWEFSVFGTNLTNEYVLNSGFFHGLWGFDFATVARPREAGASVKVFFE